jgi:predicted transcriptional regulator
MSTTTIRIPDELKQRIARAAERSGTSAHAFIVEAIADKADQVERQADFHQEAAARMERFLTSGKSIPWAEAREYLLDRAAGKPARRPKARKP